MSVSVRLFENPDLGDRESPAFVGSHPLVLRLLDEVRRAAGLEIPVLIQGPTGVGKELIAQRLHVESGRSGRLVPLNVASLPEQLAESELFGSARGAFTDAHRDRTGVIEESAGGTLYLDEAAELSLGLQAKLLRVLETGAVRMVGGVRDRPVRFRLVLSTQQPARVLVQSGRWRADFYYRVAGVSLDVPPLHQRLSDIPALVDHFLDVMRRPAVRLDGPGHLANYPWPGNVRELKRAVERAAFIAGDRAITRGDLEEAVASLGLASGPGIDCVSQPRNLKDLERAHILTVLKETGGDVRMAAGILGLSRSQVYRRIQEWQLRPGHD